MSICKHVPKAARLIFAKPSVRSLILSIAVSFEAFGQSCVNGPANIKTVRDLPAWQKEEASASALRKKEYLYYDRQSEELVVYFPESLNDPSSGSTNWVEFRWQPQFVVTPTVRSVFRRVDENWLEYEYSISNGESAKRGIRWFTLVGSASDVDLVPSHPTWNPFSSRPAFGLGAPQTAIMDSKQIREPQNLGRFVGWSAKEESLALMPKEGLGQFKIRSKFLPGIVTAYANSGNAFRLNVVMPPDIHSQIVPYLMVERNYKSLATIGPKFSAQAQPSAIARDFQQVLSFVSKQGCLNLGSPLMQEIQVVLEKSASTNSRSEIKLRDKAANDFEAEIAGAVETSLGLPKQP